MIIYNVLHSVELIKDCVHTFTEYCLEGLKANEKKIAHDLQNTLMLVTALSPVIGYDKAAKIAHHAEEQEITLKQASQDLGFLTAQEYDKIVNPEKMV